MCKVKLGMIRAAIAPDFKCSGPQMGMWIVVVDLSVNYWVAA